MDGECVLLEGDFEGDWAQPSGIAVYESDGGTWVFISELGRSARYPGDLAVSPSVKKCTLVDLRLSCFQFASIWEAPHGLALDHEGNLLVTNSGPDSTSGVWKCGTSAPADCVRLMKGNWTNVVGDSKGNVIVYEVLLHSLVPALEKCGTWSGHFTCEAFGPQDPHLSGKTNSLSPLAVGPDDYVYTRDDHTLDFIRCSPENSCENLGDFYGLGSGNMAIDPNGTIYTVSLNACSPPGPCRQLELRKISCELSTGILQV